MTQIALQQLPTALKPCPKIRAAGLLKSTLSISQN